MRSISIVVTCDACGDEIEEEVEGASAIRFTVRGDEREMDLCDECLGGTFLQEARPVTNRKKREVKVKPYFCDQCDKTFGTQRGLSHHMTRMHG
jgi:hypothetical protein